MKAKTKVKSTTRRICIRNTQLRVGEYVYMGRPNRNGDSLHHWGNPFSHLQKSQATVIVPFGQAVPTFEKWLRGTAYQRVEPARRTWILQNLHRLEGQVLGCFCEEGHSCHVDVYLKLIEESHQGEQYAQLSLPIDL